MLEIRQKELTGYVQSQRPRTTACYETALRTRPNLSGRIELNWTIDAHGGPQDFKVGSGTSSSMIASSVPDCLEAIVARWRFHKACSNSASRFSWDFPPP